jgi:Zn-dependent protease
MSNDIPLGMAFYAVFLVSILLHEAAHAFTAARLGDPTAYYYGLVTLDPLPHIKRSPIGLTVIPVISYIFGGSMVGWASVPVDPFWARENRKKSAIVSLAGPGANLGLLIVAAISIRLGMTLGFFYAPESISFGRITETDSTGLANSLAIMLSIFFSENLLLLAFNLIPLPPLDGSSVLTYFLSPDDAAKYETFLYDPTYMMVGLVIAWRLFDVIFGPIHLLAVNLLYPGAGYQ